MKDTLTSGFFFWLVFTSIAAWFTHVFICISEEQWGFLIAGVLFFPVTIFHGVGIWFGVY
jgi:hypothetical protein